MKIAFLFAGEGAQSVGMGKELYAEHREARALFDMADAIRPDTSKTCFEGPADVLTQTENAQPCLFLTDLAIARTLASNGVCPDAVAGFSLGEIPAITFAGIVSDEEGFRLACARGSAMAECASKNPGATVAVRKLDVDTVEELVGGFREVWPVSYSCQGQIACAGSKEELALFCNAVKAEGGDTVPLGKWGAFHTPLMKEAGMALRRVLERMTLLPPQIPVYANINALPYPSDADAIKNTVCRQLHHSVRWEDTVRHLLSFGIDTFIEVGAGKTLSDFVKCIFDGARVFTVNDKKSLTEALAALKDE